jgi:dGTPase
MLAESQVVDVADSIAYNSHDIDDALRAGLITFDDLRQTTMWTLAEERAAAAYGMDLQGDQLSRAVVRCLIDWQVSSLLTESTRRLAQCSSADEVRQANDNVIDFEPETATLKRELEQFLFERVYRHEQVVRTTRVAERMVGQIFEEYVRDPSLLPPRHQQRLEEESPERVACDYVAGMTDRFAQRTHRTLFEP